MFWKLSRGIDAEGVVGGLRDVAVMAFSGEGLKG
jgi:hypothetical protein